MFSNGDHPELKPLKKVKRNKRKTECSVVRSRTGCGICGSENTAQQGVLYCRECEAEEAYLVLDDGWWWPRDLGIIPSCDCGHDWVGANGVQHKVRSYDRRCISVCLDCGAVASSFCPNGGHHMCWRHWKGAKFCRDCGYRKPNEKE